MSFAGRRQELSAAVSHASMDGGVRLIACIDHLMTTDGGLISTRHALSDLIDFIAEIQVVQLQIKVGEHVLHNLQARTTAFDEQNSKLRNIMADSYIKSENWTAGANMLQGIPLESSQLRFDDASKAQIWMKICRLHLENNDPVTSESYLNRVKSLLHNIDDHYLHVTFQLSRARILDSQRRFLDAGTLYLELALDQSIEESERDTTFIKACICSILAPAGPNRSNLLARLYKDDRLLRMPNSTVLQNMHLHRLLPKDVVDGFAGSLVEHQLAQLSEGSTVLQRAVIEHNMHSASYIYENISMERLSEILDLSPAKAEIYAGAMLNEGRMKGSIDQVGRRLDFMNQSSFSSALTRRTLDDYVQNWNKAGGDLAAAIETVAADLP